MRDKRIMGGNRGFGNPLAENNVLVQKFSIIHKFRSIV